MKKSCINKCCCINTVTYMKKKKKINSKQIGIAFLPEKYSNGRRMTTVSQLKTSCTVAPLNARRNSLWSNEWARDTIVLVTVVPMLAPITIGMAGRTSRTATQKDNPMKQQQPLSMTSPKLHNYAHCQKQNQDSVSSYLISTLHWQMWHWSLPNWKKLTSFDIISKSNDIISVVIEDCSECWMIKHTSGGNHGDDDGGGCGRWLQQNCAQNSNHQTSNRVVKQITFTENVAWKKTIIAETKSTKAKRHITWAGKNIFTKS